MTDPNETDRKPIFATDEQEPEPQIDDAENVEAEKEHDEPIGG